MFGQLSNRESLRDLIIAIEAHYKKCYHLGFGAKVRFFTLEMQILPHFFTFESKISG
jgi:hypothetical protein